MIKLGSGFTAVIHDFEPSAEQLWFEGRARRARTVYVTAGLNLLIMVFNFALGNFIGAALTALCAGALAWQHRRQETRMIVHFTRMKLREHTVLRVTDLGDSR